MTSRDQDLLRMAADLPKQIEPERDLWPEIQAHLNDEVGGRSAQATARARRWWTPLALAASLLLAASIGFWVGKDGLEPAPTVAQLTQTEQAEASPRTVAAGLQVTRQDLAVGIEDALHNLPPDAQAVVTENLAAINQALDEIDRVMNQAPERGVDRQLLMTMYADQLALLGNMHRVILTSNQEILL